MKHELAKEANLLTQVGATPALGEGVTTTRLLSCEHEQTVTRVLAGVNVSA